MSTEKDLQEAYQQIEKHMTLALKEMEATRAVATQYGISFTFTLAEKKQSNPENNTPDDWAPSDEDDEYWDSSEKCW